MDFDVGWRLRAVRQSAGLSQRQLATKCGLTNGAISMIEQNRTSPSIATLKKVLEVIPMTLSEFFSTELSEQEKFFFKAEELRELSPERLPGALNGNHAVSLRQVGDGRKPTLQILYEQYPPGSDTGDAMISHESDEGGIIISGEIEVTVGSEVAVLKAGDAYLFDSRLPHRFRNISEDDCIIVSACTPASF